MPQESTTALRVCTTQNGYRYLLHVERWEDERYQVFVDEYVGCFQRPIFLWSSPYLPTQQAALDEGLYYVRCVS